MINNIALSNRIKHTFLLLDLRALLVLLVGALAEEAPLALAWVAEAFLVLDLALLIFSIFHSNI